MFGFRRKRSKLNLLEMIPQLKSHLRLEWEEGAAEAALILPRTSWLERMSVKYLKQPSAIRVQLDALGSFVLSYCNGQHTVQQIADKVQERFGEEAEPLLPRLIKFMQIVEANGWIVWQER
ncbi:PqqD family protein [Polycladomyces subterraneus]|uniref:PqqD family protein n=1 Tax=Polycladomyces subterraneus TaxID=1016997 RepID=A0ABT8ITT9_9BACL|nr:PqqD family protein [Polycladomyces subterraneus]MDN4595469.1 PqqD family protein [Polycladomyces subterraneus]